MTYQLGEEGGGNSVRGSAGKRAAAPLLLV